MIPVIQAKCVIFWHIISVVKLYYTCIECCLGQIMTPYVGNILRHKPGQNSRYTQTTILYNATAVNATAVNATAVYQLLRATANLDILLAFTHKVPFPQISDG